MQHRNTQIDFVIVTALEEEREAVLAKLPGARQLPPTHDDIRVYFRSELPVTFSDGSTHSYSIIVLSLLNMGRVEAVNATKDAITHWHPRYVLLVGIAGGVSKNDASLGDILVSDQIVDYELQKLEADGDKPRDRVHPVDPRLLLVAQSFNNERWFTLITVPRPSVGSPKRIVGPIATGDKVMARRDVLGKIMERWPKLIGIEMEAGGAIRTRLTSAVGISLLRLRYPLAKGPAESSSNVFP
jgi:nucleoside phosphorylase